MVKSTRPPANGFVAAMRKVYNPIGFSKGYNFVLFFLTIGYLMGFTLARFQYLSFYGIFCNAKLQGPNSAVPGECYYYFSNDAYKIGIMLHLFCIIPAAFLACFQFVPVIRHKLIIVHRINGYIIILLSLVADAGLLMFLRHSFGGDLATQTMAGAAVIMTTFAYVMAYINIKLLQIDQHRAWMIRAWVYFAFIVTIRLIMFIGGTIITMIGSYYITRPCAQINSILGESRTLSAYPACQAFYDGTNIQQYAVLHANLNGSAAETAAAFGVTFGAAGWLALWIHAIAAELYLHLTPAESARLRQVSYERQLARGFKNPGFAGLTVERFGDATPFVPVTRQQVIREDSDDSVPKEHLSTSEEGSRDRSAEYRA